MNLRNKNSLKIIKYSLLVILLSLAIACIMKPSIFKITNESIIIIALACLILFSEEFNTLALGNLLTISRKVEETQEKVTEVHKETDEIRKQLLTFMVGVNLKNTTVTNVETNLRDILTVIPANDLDNGDHKNNLEKDSEKNCDNDFVWKLSDWRKIQKATIEKYVKENNLPIIQLEHRIKFSHDVEDLNPIIKRKIIYDGHLKTINSELFFEVRNFFEIDRIVWDKIYIMLSQLYTYRRAKNIQAYMVLLFVENAEIKPDENNYEYKEKLFVQFNNDFSPAKSSNLLRVEKYTFTQDEIESIIKTSRKY